MLMVAQSWLVVSRGCAPAGMSHSCTIAEVHLAPAMSASSVISPSWIGATRLRR